jgi:catechol 2,3-dioxygenase-like lactoylglutathione lyase family enzyme
VRIHHVQLACPPGGEPDLRAFYVGVLGLVELTKPPKLAARGGCWFADSAALDPSAPVGIELHLGVEENFTPARKAHPGLLWPDLDALAARLTTAGYPVIWSDPAEIPGRRRFHTADPFGNRLEFLADEQAAD